MHAHKWKRGVRENVATVKEIRRKASKIAPAYNKGALQYLPDESWRPSSQPLPEQQVCANLRVSVLGPGGSQCIPRGGTIDKNPAQPGHCTNLLAP